MIVRDALSTQCVDHSLIPTFVMKELVNNARIAPKFQVEDSSIDDHSVYFPRRI